MSRDFDSQKAELPIRAAIVDRLTAIATHSSKGRALCLIANGTMVFEAILAVDARRLPGVRARGLTIHGVKPLDHVAVQLAAAEVPAMIVVEEHSVIRGLGAAVLDSLSELPHGRILRIGIAGVFPPAGPVCAPRQSPGPDAESIAAQALDLLAFAKVT